MTEKKIVKDALPLAEAVAKIIFKNSYKYCPGSGVLDLLLFGSTLKGPAHDIDMLVIHNHAYLNEFGLITTYDEKKGHCVPDPNSKDLQKGVVRATAILESMGSPIVRYAPEAENLIFDEFRRQTENNRDCDDSYSGTFDLSYIGKIEIEEQIDFKSFLDVFSNKVKEKLYKDTVLRKVQQVFEHNGLDIDETLDMQAMHAFLLSPKEICAEERRLAIKQCADPTFWHTLLTTGRLYNKKKGKFTDPIQEKYPMAIELFKQ